MLKRFFCLAALTLLALFTWWVLWFMAMGAPHLWQRGTSPEGIRISRCSAAIRRTAASLS